MKLPKARAAIILIVPTAAVLLTACEEGLETRTFPLEHVTAENIRPLIEPYVNAEGSTIGEGTAQFPSIAVRERPSVLDQIAEIVVAHDRPVPTVTLRFQLIEADGFTDTDPAIAEVERVLRDIFGFRGYRLMADAVMSNVTPMVVVPEERATWADYQVRQRVTVGEHLYGILTDVRSVSSRPGGTPATELAVLLYREGPESRGSETLLETSVRVPDGQTVVLGNARGTSPENAIILTVRPEIR